MTQIKVYSFILSITFSLGSGKSHTSHKLLNIRLLNIRLWERYAKFEHAVLAYNALMYEMNNTYDICMSRVS